MKYVYKEDMDIFHKFAVRVFGVDPENKDIESVVLEGIDKLLYFSKSLGLPTHLRDIDVGSEAIEEMAEKTQLFGPIGRFMELDKQDVVKIFEMAI
jgi:alcohol dehydrogenase YqhD (iron-dependent ADH family)